MANILDEISAASAKAGVSNQPAPALQEVDGDGNFARGLRSGALGAGASLNALAGTAGEAMGARDFADARYADMRSLSQRAQAAAPEITSYKDVRSLGDAGKYVAGMVGQSVPSLGVGLGASIATGGALVPGLVAGTLAQAPLEAGDVAMRQQLDPAQQALPASERLANAGVTGLGSAALQSIVPAMVGGKMLGKTAAQASKMGAGKIIGRGVSDVALEGATEGAGELVKQGGGMALNPEQQLDWDAVAENAVGGAAGGAPLGVAGTMGELSSAKGEQARSFIGSAAGKVKDAAQSASSFVGSAKDKTVEQFEGFDLSGKAKATDAMGDAAEKLGTAFGGFKDKAKDALDRVAGGEDFFDPSAFKDKAGGALKAAMDMDTQQRVQAVKDWASELAADNLSPENKAKLDAFMANPGERMNEMAVAGMKQAKDLAGRASEAVKRFTEAAQGKKQKPATRPGAPLQLDNVVDVEARFVDEPKQSADYSATDKAVHAALLPFLKSRAPQLLNTGNEADINAMGKGLRTLLSDMRSGKRVRWDTYEALGEAVGSHNVPALLEYVKGAVKPAAGQDDAFYRELDGIVAVKDAHDSLTKVMTDSLDTDTPVRPEVLRQAASGLTQWIKAYKGADTPQGAQRRRILDYDVRKQMEAYFGKNTDKVMQAAEHFVTVDENRLEQNRVKYDEEGNPVGEEQGDVDGTTAPTASVRYHEKARVYLNADDDPGKGGNPAAVTSALARAQAKSKGARYARFGDELSVKDHPNAKAKYDELTKQGLNAFDGDLDLATRYADDEINKYGMIVSEKSSDADELVATIDELEDARLDGHNYSRSASKLDKELTGLPYHLDAVGLTRMMRERLKGEGNTRDIVGRRPKDAQHFMDGVAMVQEATGKTFDVPDSTVVSEGGLTYGEAKRLAADGRKVQGSGGKSAQIDDQINRAKWSLHYATKEGKTEQADKAKNKLRQLGKTVEREMIADSQPEDLTDFASETREGIRVDKGRVASEIARTQLQIEKLTESLKTGADGAEVGPQLAQLYARMEKLTDQLVAERDARGSLGSGQQEFDPFGPTFQNGRDLDTITGGEGIYTDGGEGRLPARGDSLDQVRKDWADKKGHPEALRGAATRITESAEGRRTAPGLLGGELPADKRLPVPDKRTNAERAAEQLKGAEAAPEFLNNPPENYTTERAQTLVQRAKARRDELSQQLSDLDPEHKDYDALSDLYIALGLVVRTGKQVLEGDGAVAKMEGRPDPKAVAAKQAAFLEKARSGDQGLLAQMSSSNDAKGLQRAAQALAAANDEGSLKTLDTINQRLSTLVQDPDVEYGLQLRKYSMETPQPGAGPRNLKPTFDYLKRVLDDSVVVDANSPIMHAGEFVPASSENGHMDTIHLSAQLLNPLTTAFHEAMHVFVSRLMAKGQGTTVDVLHQAASSPTVRLRLHELLKHSPEAQAQLNNAEERIAYMYQFHAAGHDLGLGQPARSLFGRVAEFLRSVLGVWSNDERALHIMDYFHSGEYAKALKAGTTRDIREALMAPGRNAAVERIKSATRPLTELADQVASAGHQRLRDTGIPALRELADHVKLQGTDAGSDPGFIPASRTERAQRMNRLAQELHGTSKEILNAAMESMQRADPKALDSLATPEDRLAARLAIKKVRATLAETKAYMEAAGVEVGDLGPDYFPRVWDVSYIAANKAEFLGMLQKYKQSGQMMGDPKELLQRLMTSEGNEFTIETNRPGMQFLKPRELAFIEPADAAQFVNKNLYETLNSYVTQATRRAEWARRFGDDGKRLTKILARAVREGATPEQIDTTNKYLMAVDGTLGDTIDPEFRRLQGNVMVYQNIRLLPLAIFSSIIDPVGIAVRGGTASDAFAAFKRGLLEIPKGFKKEALDDEATQLAQSLGVIESAALTHTLGTSFSQGMVGDTGRKLNDTFFKWNLMEQFNTSMRVSATQAAIGFLGRHAEGTASQHSMRWLAELGLRPGEVKRGKDGRVLVTQADGLSAAEAMKMREAINRWVDGAVLRPDAADKPIWMSDPHFALISHLKQFTFSFNETILKRLVHEASMGNNAAFMAAASYVPIMIAADILKGGLQTGGGEPAWKKDWGLADYVSHGVQRAGLLGVSQFGVDVVEDVKRGGAGIGALAGPTLEQLGEGVSVLGGRESFGTMLLRAMPANALYSNAVRGGGNEVEKMERAE